MDVADLVRAGADGRSGLMLHRPVAHFILLGALLFGLARWTAGDAAARPRLGLDAAATAALRRDWIARDGRAPSDDVWARLVDDALDEEVLYRAALARGIDRDDPVVQARLIHAMRFVADAGADGAALYRDALGLGLADGDLVVRRRLIERMRMLLQEPALAEEPSDTALQAYLDAHGARFALPARIRLTQIFLSRERRGAALDADVRRLLQRLGPADVIGAAALGDALPLPAGLPIAAAPELAKLFGPQFAAAALSLAPGGWYGPLPSAYGVHLVWVHERIPASPPALDAVRTQVRAAVREERARAALRDGVRALRAGYVIDAGAAAAR